MLIDSDGCPTESAIMGALRKEVDDPKMLLADFDAFKFPSSDVVQFRAHVTPCMPTCEPVDCSVTDYRGGSKVVESYGRRRRSASAADHPLEGGSYLSRHARALTPVNGGSNLLVTSSFVVVDKFNKSKQPPSPPPKKEEAKPRGEGVRQRSPASGPAPRPPPFTPQPAVPGMTFVETPATEFRPPTLPASAAGERRRGEGATSTATAASSASSSEICLNAAGMVVGLLMLLVAQLMIVFAVVHYMQRRRIRRKTKAREAEDTIAVFNPYTTPRPIRR